MMTFSLVIPVWNGATVIGQCLEAIYALDNDRPLEVIAVDNASRDESAHLIAARFPQVTLLPQPVNLGFAGGVNVGIRAARGDVIVLLNQDCLPQSGWLRALAAAFEARPDFGIAGCTLYTPDNQIDHAGARLMRPGALGEHLTDVGGESRPVEYVTGAAMAIRRSAFDAIGLFDEGFYPAYFEEADFCFRAHRRGLETGYVPAARLTHLRSSREAQADLIKHWANQQRMRYRFVIKQFDAREIGDFIAYELDAAEHEVWFDQAIGRVIGARDTLRGLPDIIERRRLDCADDLLPAVRRQIEVGFTAIMRRSYSAAERIGAPVAGGTGGPPVGARFITPLRRWLGRLRSAVPTGEVDQLRQQMTAWQAEVDRRLKILEILADYEYR
jgi:GT2 family glycosyltransferase